MTIARIKLYLIIVLFPCVFPNTLSADGGYFSYSESIAVSADQRAIIIQNGDTIGITFSTAYTGDGKDFGWVIPTPVVPETGNVFEAGETAEEAFKQMEEITAPVLEMESGHSGGCFPAGVEVLTEGGAVPIEKIQPGIMIVSYDFENSGWARGKVSRLISRQYKGDLISIDCGGISLRATGNHPFFVLEGEGLNSRPAPPDIPDDENVSFLQGRWVEARDLKPGDLLECADSVGLKITGLSISETNTTVYNLAVEGYHNYAVCSEGILVHNKGSHESESISIDSKLLIKVHGHVKLENFEISILEAYDADVLMNWLERNGYQADPSAISVFKYYINKGWSFVAVKLNPEKVGEYKNEFLPSLTVLYTYDKLVFPLKISSVSSVGDVKISLYVISDKTVGLSNYEIVDYTYPKDIHHFDPEIDWEKYMRDTLESVYGPGLVRIWSGEVSSRSPLVDVIDKLLHNTSSFRKKVYLTRLDTIISPAMMKDDIELSFSKKPEKTKVVIHAWLYSALIDAVQRRDTEEVRKLLDNGYNPNASENSDAALKTAVRIGSFDIVKMLIDEGADVNYGFDLYWAACDGKTDIAGLLIDAGAYVNTGLELAYYNGAGEYFIDVHTPLTGAVEHRHVDTVKLLLEAGADMYAGTPNALEIAEQKGYAEIKDMLIDWLEYQSAGGP